MITNYMGETIKQYNEVKNTCYELFTKKQRDYGLAWRILRPSSITDQILIKAKRIRSIEDKDGVQKISDDIKDDYIGIINYSIMGLIQLEFQKETMSIDDIIELYNKNFNTAKELMLDKNHDYDEVWREMRISSYTDLILMKIYRVKQIEDNKGVTLISEDIGANYMDMINYSVFALIKILED